MRRGEYPGEIPKGSATICKPEMSAYEVCDKLVEAIKSQKYDVIIINFANPDMVGHTGVEDAAIKAVEAVDCLCGKSRRGCEGSERSDVYLCRSRKCGAARRFSDWRSLHRAYDQSGSLLDESCLRFKRGRMSWLILRRL